MQKSQMEYQILPDKCCQNSEKDQMNLLFSFTLQTQRQQNFG